MNCKYCHLNTHYIDKCPTIICKICKGVGHPQWLCIEKSPKNNQNGNKMEKKFTYSDEIRKKNKSENNYKNISYYLKLKNGEWGNLVDI